MTSSDSNKGSFQCWDDAEEFSEGSSAYVQATSSDDAAVKFAEKAFEQDAAGDFAQMEVAVRNAYGILNVYTVQTRITYEAMPNMKRTDSLRKGVL